MSYQVPVQLAEMSKLLSQMKAVGDLIRQHTRDYEVLMDRWTQLQDEYLVELRELAKK